MRGLPFAGVFVLLIAGCSSQGDGTVAMNGGQRYEPKTLTVRVGETVTWRNESGESHTVTAYEESLPVGATYFSSGDLPSEKAARSDLSAGLLTEGEEFSVTFDEVGRYEYFCVPHEQQGMRGTVIVEP